MSCNLQGVQTAKGLAACRVGQFVAGQAILCILDSLLDRRRVVVVLALSAVVGLVFLQLVVELVSAWVVLPANQEGLNCLWDRSQWRNRGLVHLLLRWDLD